MRGRGIQRAAGLRLAEHRAAGGGPVAAAQAALWAALMAGDMPEALRQADIVGRLRGPVPMTPERQALLDRLEQRIQAFAERAVAAS